MEIKSEFIEIPLYKRKYWNYQYDLTEKHIIPLLKGWGFNPRGKKILDIGCAEGGVMAALADQGAICQGVEISPGRVRLGEVLCNEDKKRNLKFILGDILENSTLEGISDNYDLILLRDVIEHIGNKIQLLTKVRELLKLDGKVLITFPPFYSPFGGHQQMLRSRLRFLPFLHLLPGVLFNLLSNHLLKREDNNKFILKEMEFFRRERFSLRRMEKLATATGFEIEANRLYLSRPSFKYRYGLRVIDARWLGKIPLLREILVTGAFYFLRRAG